MVGSFIRRMRQLGIVARKPVRSYRPLVSKRLLPVVATALTFASFPVLADQVIDTSNDGACVATGSTLGAFNVFTAFDNGTFGVRETGDPAQQFSPASYPYATPINGTYRQYVGRANNGQFNPPAMVSFQLLVTSSSRETAFSMRAV